LVPPSEPLFNAFRYKYDVRVRELKTTIGIGPPSLTHPPQQDITGLRKSKEFKVFNNAIWDTGASHTVITPQVVATLKKEYGIQPTGITQVNAVGDKPEIKHEAETYLVDVLLPDNVLLPNLNVLCDSISRADVLVGMDIIQRGDFCISNAKGKTTFTFCIPPFKKTTDLYIKVMEENAKIRKRNKRKR
jgi:hypothetical protein